MKAILVAALAARVLCAADVPERVLRLIGPDARWVYGGDLAQYRHTPWHEVAPWVVDVPDQNEVERLVSIGTADRGARPILVLTGAIGAAAGDRTMLAGDPEALKQALERARAQPGVLSDTALKVKHLAESYDAWFFVLRPLENAGIPESTTRTKRRQELFDIVQEVSGGIRLGAYAELQLEIVTKNAEDALTLAGVARWLPGLLDLEQQRPFARLLDAVEGLSIRAEGTRVRISCYVAESRLRDAIAASKSPRVEE